MPFISDKVTSEGLSDTRSFRMQAQVQNTAASTFTFTTATAGAIILLGTTAGQIVKLGDATTYQVGREFWIYNDSSQIVNLIDGSDTVLSEINSEIRIKVILVDNSTVAGIWSITELRKDTVSVGTTIIANFSSTASSNNNKFLDNENLSSSDTLPGVVPDNLRLRRITFTNINSNPTGTLEFRVNTTVGTPLFTAVLSGQQTESFAIDVAVNKADQINCKIASDGSNINKPLVKVYA